MGRQCFYFCSPSKIYKTQFLEYQFFSFNYGEMSLKTNKNCVYVIFSFPVSYTLRNVSEQKTFNHCLSFLLSFCHKTQVNISYNLLSLSSKIGLFVSTTFPTVSSKVQWTEVATSSYSQRYILKLLTPI